MPQARQTVPLRIMPTRPKEQASASTTATNKGKLKITEDESQRIVRMIDAKFTPKPLLI